MRFVLKRSLPNSYFIGLLIIAFLIRIYLFSRRKTDATALDVYNIIQIFITLGLGFYLILRRDSQYAISIIFRSPLSWIILLYSLGVISGLWSAIPLFSAYFGLEGLIYIIALTVIYLNKEDKFEAEKLAIKSSYFFIVLMIIEIIRFRGVGLNLFHWHTNTYSTVAAMLFGYCYGEFNNSNRELSYKERRILKSGIWASLAFVILGTSSASNLSLLAAFLIITLISGRRSLKVIAVILFGAALLINQLYGELIFNLIFPGKSPESVSMMHGRMTLWVKYFDLIEQKPMAGWGFAALSRLPKLYNINTHNSIIEIVGGVGVIGLLFFTMFLIRIYSKLLKYIRSPYIIGVIGAVTAGLVNSNAISFIGAPTNAIFFAFIIWVILGILTIKEVIPDLQKEDPAQNV